MQQGNWIPLSAEVEWEQLHGSIPDKGTDAAKRTSKDIWGRGMDYFWTMLS